ncbi:MAG: aldehyde dehydrogenase family protein [Planctomycetota bacterium]
MTHAHAIWIAGKRATPNIDLEVVDKFTGSPIARVAVAGPDLVEEAIASAFAARAAFASVPVHARRDMLRHAADRFDAQRDDLADLLRAEGGKPISAARGEVSRLIETFTIASEEAVRIAGETIPMETSARTEGYRATTQRVPIGACGFITPFNFPLNLVAHKVAPAIAAGCPFVLKPSDKTPLSALAIAGVLDELDLPEGSWSVLCCSDEDAAPIVADERLRLLSFTGSDTVGRELAKQAGMKRIVMELGGNAACIVDETADLDDAIDRIIAGAYTTTGQSCISVQRIIAHASIYSALRDRLVERVRDLPAGDPAEPGTVVGPMISADAAGALHGRITHAVDAGAAMLIGGTRDGALLAPTLLERVPPAHALNQEEAFGPVAMLASFDDFDEALAQVNDSRFGLQAGVFTTDLRRAHRAWNTLEVGAVVINDAPSFRVDHMPYGGVKHSGLGREGPRAAIADMTEERLLIVRGV